MFKGVLMKWFILFLLPTMAFAKIKTEKIVYEKNGTKMEGFLAYNDRYKKPMPGILIVHDWMGIGKNTEERAIQLANKGYVAFAADIYGVGNLPKDQAGAKEIATKFKTDYKLLRAHAQAALDTLSKQKQVNKDKLAAIGYCFGGTTALELARDGAPILGVVSIHGGLATQQKASKLAPKVLALHGGDDPFVKPEEVAGFEQEMRDAKADWQFIAYGNAVHSFTIKDAGDDNSKGAAYNKSADMRSWIAMMDFFKEIF
jgi:dienelactone hydrolase